MVVSIRHRTTFSDAVGWPPFSAPCVSGHRLLLYAIGVCRFLHPAWMAIESRSSDSLAPVAASALLVLSLSIVGWAIVAHHPPASWQVQLKLKRSRTEPRRRAHRSSRSPAKHGDLGGYRDQNAGVPSAGRRQAVIRCLSNTARHGGMSQDSGGKIDSDGDRSRCCPGSAPGNRRFHGLGLPLIGVH